jgi:hypothetical protein
MSSKVRFAVIGTNFITDNLLQVAGSVAGFELAGVFSRTQERGKAPLLSSLLFRLVCGCVPPFRRPLLTLMDCATSISTVTLN